jgi:hypothetical protein
VNPHQVELLWTSLVFVALLIVFGYLIRKGDAL